jgi:hypothetical protein
VLRVVAEEQLRLAALAEQARRLDRRTHDDGPERSGGNGDGLASHDAENDRVRLGLEVPVDPVDVARLQREPAREVDDRYVVQRTIREEGERLAGIEAAILLALR